VLISALLAIDLNYSIYEQDMRRCQKYEKDIAPRSLKVS